MIENRTLIVVFKDGEPILTNSDFNAFFGVASFELYKANFGPFVDNFVPHPSYFHKEKFDKSQQWFEAIMDLEEDQRVVSMMTSAYEPCAFSVAIDKSEDGYLIASFTDITQMLIKRIMIENNVSIDKESGAYDKKYFLQITQSYEDAALFNEKIVAISEISLISKNPIEKDYLVEFVEGTKLMIRQDDMLVRFEKNKFLLIYLVDDEIKSKQVSQKIQTMLDKNSTQEVSFILHSVSQRENENIKHLIKRLTNPSNE